ncbi:hypothetical protein [Mucilaginibacter gotjawali]|uniref:Uncharacterized protein n=2 Tax=Mucilaginibacter gotjawali TaxID=1550579 RepID=A0A839SCL0_9SPHI|nr:hypothetical protein [Mucilaginibacter gotjawali]MBB3054307.1 hypothetical protein [Mucilaginibacter gotjawali]BAU51857.1 hypothetical protein MgSA37_00006 [Mucilaginibacter gotjawali]
MVPSVKFTLIAWVAIIGFGLVSFVLKNKKDAARIHPSNATKGFVVIKSFTPDGCLTCPPAYKLITRVHQKTKNLPVYQFRRAAYIQRQNQYTGLLYAPPVNGSVAFLGSEGGNAVAGSK